MTIKNSTHNIKNGRYVIGGSTEVSSWAIEAWDKVEMPRDKSDLIYYMEKKYEGRPDMLGHVFYADSSLWWVICQFNGITDPMSELIEGKLLYIPTKSRVAQLVSPTAVVGGIPSTR